MVKTKKYLERMGVKVDISTELAPDLKRYHIVHLFGLNRPQELYIQAKNAISQGKSVVLSPIFVDYSEYEKKGRPFPWNLPSRFFSQFQVEYLKVVARAVLSKEFHRGTLSVLKRGFYTRCRQILEMASLLLPNSESEMERIKKAFKLNGKPYVVIPNGVDPEVFNYEQVEIPRAFEKYKGCVLCVARIEGGKSQINLVKAARELPYKVVLAGNPARHHHGYFRKVKKLAPTNVEFVGYIPEEKLPGLYKAARVHVLPSWMETTGLVSLEAGAMLCNVVITRKGDAHEYFGDLAFYCEPDDPVSIRDAILRAYNAPPPFKLQSVILNNYTWEKAAEKTLEAYKMLL